jgi:hypothetical protein
VVYRRKKKKREKRREVGWAKRKYGLPLKEWGT